MTEEEERKLNFLAETMSLLLRCINELIIAGKEQEKENTAMWIRINALEERLGS